MKEFTLAMALVDFIPVLLFAAAAIILQRDLYFRMSKGAFALFAAGTIDVICAGALKALYKLLYALGVCDFTALNQMFFPVQSLGFLLAGLGMIAMLTHRQGRTMAIAAAPAVWSGTFLFVGLMVAGLAMMDAVPCSLAKRVGRPAARILFLVSFILCLGMGYLSSKSFDKAAMNWIAQGINILGQGTLLAGVLMLHRAGLRAASSAQA